MTWVASEISPKSSRPVALVRFSCSLQNWYQTSAPSAIVGPHDGNTYVAIPGLSVGEIVDSGNYLRSVCDIETDWSHPLVKRYPGTPIDEIVNVDIWALQGSDYTSWWDGYLATIRRKEQKGRKAIMKCVASYSALGIGSLCLRCGRACQVPVYSELCGLDLADWQVNGMVESLTGDEVTSATFATEADGWWTGGPITINGYGRMVADHTDDTIILSESIPGLAVGMPLVVAPGCDGKLPTCDTKFDHRLDYKGYPDIPNGKNPFTQGVA